MLTVITGPPAGGKTTWVAERARHGDIVIDYDALAAAITPELDRRTDPPRPVVAVTQAARRAALDEALRHTTTTRVWVIHSEPSPRDLRTYQRHNADIITIDPGYETCLERAIDQRPPRLQYVVQQWYFDRY